ncbi:hypothetical protein KKF91_09030 [Myxococcota bacterium]|nr:hypothetical protein [Myxococcota bacterium]MBU1430684.1 hypothetical protein [Myxococcota bacterium]MBU1899482.1 hypothetical protein [Myxococcota bacterium]
MGCPTTPRLLLIGALLLGSAQATVRPATLGKLLDLSEAVIIARVVHQETQATTSPLEIFTDTHLIVERAVAGVKLSGSLILRQRGGQAAAAGEVYTQKIFGQARLNPGERVLLFLERASAGNLVIAGMAQGKYLIEVDPKSGVEMARRDLSDVYVLQHRGEVITPPGLPTDQDFMPLDDLLALLRGGLRPAASVAVEPIRPMGARR